MGDNIQIKRMVEDVIQFRNGILEGGVLSELEHTLVADFYQRYMNDEVSDKREESDSMGPVSDFCHVHNSYFPVGGYCYSCCAQSLLRKEEDAKCCDDDSFVCCPDDMSTAEEVELSLILNEHHLPFQSAECCTRKHCTCVRNEESCC